MKGILNTVVAMLKKAGYFAMQYFFVAVQWVMRLGKIQTQRLTRRGVQKKLEKAYSGLGGEIYALYKQGVTGWESMPSVQQHLKLAEEVESEVFKVDGDIEEINASFRRRKDEIAESYARKRAEVSTASED